MDKTSPKINDELFSIHFLKFLSLIGVVFIHYVFFFKDISFPTAIFRFCVPIFILSSIFLSERSNLNKEADKSFLKKRFLRLAIPFIFWSLFYYWIYSPKETGPLKILTKHFLGYGWSGQYYFLILFQLTIVYFFLRKIKLIKKRYLILTGGLTLVVVLTLFYGIYSNKMILKINNRLFLYWLFYTLFAIWLARNYDRFKKNKYLDSAWGIVILLLTPVLIQLENYFYNVSEQGEEYCKVSILIASTSMFTLILTENALLKLIASDQARNIIRIVSNYSLGIFCLNPFVIGILGEIVNHYKLTIINDAFLLIAIPLIILTCISISKVLEKLRLKILIK